MEYYQQWDSHYRDKTIVLSSIKGIPILSIKRLYIEMALWGPLYFPNIANVNSEPLKPTQRPIHSNHAVYLLFMHKNIMISWNDLLLRKV